MIVPALRHVPRLLCVVFLLGLWAASAAARPGGGHTFGGGSSHHSYGGSGSSGGGGGGDAELVFWIIRLIFTYPKLGIPVLLLLAYLWYRAKQAAPQSWTSEHAAAAGPSASTRSGLAALCSSDPDFSRVVFEDFAYRLYAAAQRARHDARALGALAPYLADDVARGLAARAAEGAVSHVVVGALRIVDVGSQPAQGEAPRYDEITLKYEANLTIAGASGGHTEYVVERWVLCRAAGVRTKPPEETERLGCPSCGAPFSASDGRRCAYCGQVVADGRFAWSVVRRSELTRERRAPALTGNQPEAGTDNPTRRDPDAEAEFRALSAADPAVDEGGIATRLRFIYAELNRAWSAAELTAVRGLVSDGMFDYLRYWVEAYVAAGLRNALTDMAISSVERVKVVRDRYFDAITFRIWASGYDATVDLAGKTRGGSTTTKRAYTEYWTLIRASGVQAEARADAHCPSCAAPLAVSMAGNCSHCGSHVTRGEFDWVLSKIEQDDVYEG